MPFIQPLDFETIFINALSGSIAIFSFLMLIAIGALAGRFRMPNVIFLMMVTIFAVIMSFYLADFFLIAMILIGLIIPYFIIKLISRA